ncbi:MAG TPA: alanine--glyoxylate aminotransferase family protein [Acidimicrobiia bacterium]|nr:alanine--glyoxylate aminotransferase family protein [Acidimicrobiia bacterium]
MSQPLKPGRFFLPGPTEVHPDVLEAQNGPMIGHRGEAIVDLLTSIQTGLEPVFATTRPVIVSTSSATGLMEACVRNGVLDGRVLSLVNGAFSKRFADIARASGKTVDVWEVEWGHAHEADELDHRLRQADYDAVTLSQSETSTGALQDLQAITSVVNEHTDTLLLVDSVTGIGGVETWTDDWGVDFILTGSQKALALPPGLAFGVADEAILERSAKIPDKGWYFDLEMLHEQITEHQTPATPAISLLYALDYQLKLIAEEGMAARWQRHLDMQARTFKWVEEMQGQGQEIEVFAAEGHRSPTVTCVATDRSREIVSGMFDRGWVIGGGYGPLKDSTIRIGHMGDHTMVELEELLEVLTDVMS